MGWALRLKGLMEVLGGNCGIGADAYSKVGWVFVRGSSPFFSTSCHESEVYWRTSLDGLGSEKRGK
jgi:hypothetical protein